MIIYLKGAFIISVIIIIMAMTFIYKDNYMYFSSKGKQNHPTSFKSARKSRNTCKDLLESGNFTDDLNSWIPQGGCRFHNYDTSDLRQCLIARSHRLNKTNYLSFIGDSRIRYQYGGFIQVLDRDFQMFNLKKKNNWYADPTINTVIEFRYLRLPQYIAKALQDWEKYYQIERPDFIMAGTALHLLQDNYQLRDLKSVIEFYGSRLQAINKGFSRPLKQGTQIIWKLQDPVYVSDMVRKFKKFANNTILRDMNAIAEKTLQNISGFWRSGHTVAERYIESTHHRDGIHLNPEAIKLDVQIWLNYLCNQHMDFVVSDWNVCCLNEE